MTSSPPALVAPAGSPGALQAAVQYGADAVYLGLRHLSARAHAANFSLAQLPRAVELAHAGGCEVLVTLNTLLRSDEIPLASRLLQAVAEAGVDAVVLQDLGMLALARSLAPKLRLHGSTQMAIHNVEGAAAAAALGLRRVVLARELSLDEIAAIHEALPGLELEVFVHGSLCYAYSGLCLASAMAEERRRGRASKGHSAGGSTREPSLAMVSTRSFSGNRGRCTQPCRRPFHHQDGGREELGLPFSLRDLVGLELVPQLMEAGVGALKIEGRLRSPTYVAAACHAYRGAIDQAAGRTPPSAWDPEDAELTLRSLFSRRASTGYLVGAGRGKEQGLRHPPARVQPVMQGHLGPRVGRVLRVDDGSVLALLEQPITPGDRLLASDAGGRLRHLELRWLRDEAGLDLDGAPAGSTVTLPPPERYRVAEGSELRLAHSPSAGRRFPTTIPTLLPPDQARPPVQLQITTTAAWLTVEARAGGCVIRDRYQLGPEPVDALRAPTIAAVMEAEEGERGLGPVRCDITETEALRTPRKALVRVRRDILRRLELALELQQLEERYTAAPSAPVALPGDEREARQGETWILRSDQPTLLGLAREQGFAELELVLDPRRPERLHQALDALPPEALGCVLPPVLRGADRDAIRDQIDTARQAGVCRWVLANIGHGALVGRAPSERRWGDDPLYCANPLARRVLISSLDLAGVTLPLELDRPSTEALLACDPTATVVVWADVAVFRAALPPHLPRGLDEAPLLDELEHPYHRARQGRSAVLVDGVPLCLSPHLPALRAAGGRRFRVDLCWRPYRAEDAARLLARIRAGEGIEGSSAGNLTRRWL